MIVFMYILWSTVVFRSVQRVYHFVKRVYQLLCTNAFDTRQNEPAQFGSDDEGTSSVISVEQEKGAGDIGNRSQSEVKIETSSLSDTTTGPGATIVSAADLKYIEWMQTWNGEIEKKLKLLNRKGPTEKASTGDQVVARENCEQLRDEVARLKTDNACLNARLNEQIDELRLKTTVAEPQIFTHVDQHHANKTVDSNGSLKTVEVPQRTEGEKYDLIRTEDLRTILAEQFGNIQAVIQTILQKCDRIETRLEAAERIAMDLHRPEVEPTTSSGTGPPTPTPLPPVAALAAAGPRPDADDVRSPTTRTPAAVTNPPAGRRPLPSHYNGRCLPPPLPLPVTAVTLRPRPAPSTTERPPIATRSSSSPRPKSYNGRCGLPRPPSPPVAAARPRPLADIRTPSSDWLPTAVAAVRPRSRPSSSPTGWPPTADTACRTSPRPTRYSGRFLPPPLPLPVAPVKLRPLADVCRRP